MPATSVTPIIGMEIHVQLATRTKMFCGCAVEFGAPPNTRVCAVCGGLPGALPVVNRHAVELSLRVAAALECDIARTTKWDRKSYYYPDMPKNYQTSQFDMPIGLGGHFDVPMRADDPTQTRSIRIRRAHLEEDAGKSSHEGLDHTRVDLNRAGTPLLEIVTEPDIVGAQEAYAFAVELHRLVRHLGVSEADMQKGQMRFEPNVNVAIVHEGREYRTPISEVKNLNSFRAVQGAVAYEIDRQVAEWQADHTYTLERLGKMNFGWNDARGMTEFQRGKEDAHDYRYFPDPDLVPVIVDDAWLSTVRSAVCELPLRREARFARTYGLSQSDAGTLSSDRATADLFDQAVQAGGEAKTLGRQFISFWSALANARGVSIGELGITAADFAELSQLAARGDINATTAAAVADKMVRAGGAPREIVEREGMLQVRDAAAVCGWVTEVLAANAKAVSDARQNPKKAQAAIGFLRGQVMKLSGGKADPKLVGELIEQRMRELSE